MLTVTFYVWIKIHQEGGDSFWEKPSVTFNILNEHKPARLPLSRRFGNTDVVTGAIPLPAILFDIARVLKVMVTQKFFGKPFSSQVKHDPELPIPLWLSGKVFIENKM